MNISERIQELRRLWRTFSGDVPLYFQLAPQSVPQAYGVILVDSVSQERSTTSRTNWVGSMRLSIWSDSDVQIMTLADLAVSTYDACKSSQWHFLRVTGITYQANYVEHGSKWSSEISLNVAWTTERDN